MKNHIKLFIVFSIILMLFLSGCSPKIETDDAEISLEDGKLEMKDKETGDTVTIEQEGEKIEIKDEKEKTTAIVDGDKMEVKSEEGDSVYQLSEKGGLSLPEGYPEDLVPIIKDANITMSAKNDEDNEIQYGVTYETNTKMKEALEYYKEVLQDSEDFFNIQSEDTCTVGGFKNGFEISVLLYQDEKNTQVTIGLIKAIEKDS